MNRFNDFDSYVQTTMESWHCPGVAIAIVSDGKPVYTRAFGVRDYENGRELTTDTRFPMASVTKAFTATSAAMLVDDGLLEWNTPVREYVPEFILNDRYVTGALTIRDMLSHRTGLPRHDLSAWRLDISRGEFIRRMRHLKFAATFRERFIYNNLMYYAVPYIVEKLSGMQWEQFVAKRIFQPLGMISSNFSPESEGGQDTALGYRAERDDQGEVTGFTQVPFGGHTSLSPSGAGALFSTLSDMTRWIEFHLNDGKIDGRQLLSAENIRILHQPHTIVPTGGIGEALHNTTISTYGLGWMIDPYRGHTLVHHSGGVEGHSVHTGFIRAGTDANAADTGVVVLTNIAFSAFPQILLYEAIDRALDLPESNWSSRYHAVVDPLFKAAAQSVETTEHDRIAEAPPTHGMDTFTGEFETDGYPEFAVRLLPENELQARLTDSLEWSSLRHIHYNVFEWHIVDFDMRVKVRFLVNDAGEVDSVSIPLEPEVEDLVFRRKAPTLSDAQRKGIVGEYIPEMEGIRFSVSETKGTLYLAQTGAAPQEMSPYRADGSCIAFRVDRARIEFPLDPQGNAERLVVKAQDATLEAARAES